WTKFLPPLAVPLLYIVLLVFNFIILLPPSCLPQHSTAIGGKNFVQVQQLAGQSHSAFHSRQQLCCCPSFVQCTARQLPTTQFNECLFANFRQGAIMAIL